MNATATIDLELLQSILADPLYLADLLRSATPYKDSWPFGVRRFPGNLTLCPHLASLADDWLKWPRLVRAFLITEDCTEQRLSKHIGIAIQRDPSIEETLLRNGWLDALDVFLAHTPVSTSDSSIAAQRLARIARARQVKVAPASRPDTRTLAPVATPSASKPPPPVAPISRMPPAAPAPKAAPAFSPVRPAPDILSSSRPPAPTPAVAPVVVAPPSRPASTPTEAIRTSKRIVQISGPLGRHRTDDPDALIVEARRVVLDWLASKGAPLPSRAAEGTPFEIDITRTLNPVSVEVGGGCWAMQFDTHDQDAQGRIWRTEVVLSKIAEQALIGVGLTVVDQKGVDSVRHTSIPGVIRLLADKVGLLDECHPLSVTPIDVETEAQLDELITLIESSARNRPLVVISCDENDLRCISPAVLTGALAGLAHVAAVDNESSWALTRRYGKPLSVFGAAARIYRPAFDPDTDTPTRHPLFVGKRGCEYPAQLRDRIKELIAEDSARGGNEVVPTYGEVRRWIADHRIKEARRSASSEVEKILQLAAENKRLTEELSERDERIAEVSMDRDGALDLAADHEDMVRQLKVRVAWLEDRVEALEANTPKVDDASIVPASWDDIESWVERRLGGRVRLLPQAAKAARSSVFKDIPFAYHVLKMLGDIYQPMRSIGGAEYVQRCVDACAALRVDISKVGAALTNHRVKENYMARWNGKRIELDMHVSGSSSRRQEDGFRLYFYYDEEQEIVVVGHLPTHLPNSLT